MTIIVYAEDRSGRRDCGQYTVGSIEQAFANLNFTEDGEVYFSDREGEEQLAPHDALTSFNADGELSFYNEDGEQVRFTLAR